MEAKKTLVRSEKRFICNNNNNNNNNNNGK